MMSAAMSVGWAAQPPIASLRGWRCRRATPLHDRPNASIAGTFDASSNGDSENVTTAISRQSEVRTQQPIRVVTLCARPSEGEAVRTHPKGAARKLGHVLRGVA
jgi:hypothetical protein